MSSGSIPKEDEFAIANSTFADKCSECGRVYEVEVTVLRGTRAPGVEPSIPEATGPCPQCGCMRRFAITTVDPELFWEVRFND